jgi:PKD repeat protein
VVAVRDLLISLALVVGVAAIVFFSGSMLISSPPVDDFEANEIPVSSPEPVVVVTPAVSEESTSVSNNAPTASFTATPTSGQAPLVVSFNASGSSDSDGSITSYAWSFGDRGIGILPGSTVRHTYNATYNGTRTYRVQLTVTDNDGATDTAFRTIQVSASSSRARDLIWVGTLLDDFEANEISASSKYKGKVIAIRGYVNSVRINDYTGEPYVTVVRSPDEWGLCAVRCIFPVSAQASLTGLREGNSVIITGTCEGYSFCDVRVKNCFLGEL